MPRESKQNKIVRITKVATQLQQDYPKSCCALVHENPFQLLVATVLSAQTTDIAVNAATPGLFRDYPAPADLAAAELSDVEQHVNSIGLWRNKAKNIIGLSKRIVEVYEGQVPDSLEELVTLPGVARKTATAVLSTAMHKQVGLTVDTHMIRIHGHLRFTNSKDAVKVARDLESILPKEHWEGYTHRIIDHGRLICVARRPRCGICALAEFCPNARSEAIGYKPENDDKVPASAKGLSWKAYSQQKQDLAKTEKLT